ncbi:hypothetical protein L3V82_01115 [Thiotrichales bacterium 19S3-7]|nr:hypothetical protein [Thiotrichales bacterium 19S3-7]MCF6800761.1 hypothetical protein [Thiotrichales bacterium 19S3-11]
MSDANNEAIQKVESFLDRWKNGQWLSASDFELVLRTLRGEMEQRFLKGRGLDSKIGELGPKSQTLIYNPSLLFYDCDNEYMLEQQAIREYTQQQQMMQNTP